MEKTKYRDIIEFLTREHCKTADIHQRLHNVYGDSAPSLATVKNWAREAKWKRESLEDAPRSGRPATAVIVENVAAVEEWVLEDRRISIHRIADILSIGHNAVQTILHKHLNMTKVSARWVPRILSADQRHVRVTCAQELLHLSATEGPNFFSRIVTGDESWVYYYDPKSAAETKEWKRPESPQPTQPRASRSARKLMMTVFWDQQGILLLDYLPRGQKMNGQYYATLMSRLREAIKKNRRGLLSHGVLLLHDNAPVHKSKVAQVAIREAGFEELNHPPYSPDIAPSDFYLFSHFKRYMRGKFFEDDNELCKVVNDYFDSKTSDFYHTGVHALQDRWQRVINVHGAYFE
jgi:histone-lysine N-methyltransferase SETMAR